MPGFFPAMVGFATLEVVLAITLVLGLVAGLIFLLDRKTRKKRIVIHPKEEVIIYAAGRKFCPACQELLNGQPLARCKRDPNHVIHAICKEFVKGRCPECNGQVE